MNHVYSGSYNVYFAINARYSCKLLITLTIGGNLEEGLSQGIFNYILALVLEIL
jgi:hypothetical protein